MSSLPPRMPSSSAAAAAAKSKLLQDRTRGSTSTAATTCRITRAVQTMSSFHRTSISETARKYFHSPQHFPRILGGLMLSSGIAGYVCMGWWYERQLEERKRIYIDAYHGVQASISSSSSSSIKGGDGRNSSDNDERRVSLARKMTRRNVSSTSSSSSFSTTANDAHHAVLPNTTDSPLNLQRQVTKFW